MVQTPYECWISCIIFQFAIYRVGVGTKQIEDHPKVRLTAVEVAHAEFSTSTVISKDRIFNRFYKRTDLFTVVESKQDSILLCIQFPNAFLKNIFFLVLLQCKKF